MKIALDDNSPETIANTVLVFSNGAEFSSFELGITGLEEGEKTVLKKEVCLLLEKKGFEKKTLNPDAYILLNPARGFLGITLSNIFVKGVYNKFSREIAQTFHYCYKCRGKGCSFCSRTGKLSEESVQELIESVLLSAFDSKESKFHGCGREDKNVLMLGQGRPFVTELVAPLKRSPNLSDLEKKINSMFTEKISVHNLAYCCQKRVVEIKNTPFEKVYLAKCACAEKVSEKEVSSLVGSFHEITQFTPERVEKRRAKKEREKTAKILSSVFVDSSTFSIDVLASHGLYIKEFVSGDNDRTKPSISSLLGKKCECICLDVLEIRQN